MIAGLLIVYGVVAYRLRKLEMANMAGAVSIAVALCLPWHDIVVRTLFAFVLNIFVYLNNDYFDVEIDLRSRDKDARKTRFLADHLRAAMWVQWVLLGLLLGAAVFYDRGLLFALIGGGGVCVWYSARLKYRPFVDIPAMMLWGVAMPLCGSPGNSLMGWCLAIQLGLFSGVFETIQVMRDAEADAAEGVRTTGVVLGPGRTLWLARGLMVLAALYALLAVSPVGAMICALALAIPLTGGDAERYWTRVKMFYGVAWLWVCGWVLLREQTAGLLWSVGRDAVLALHGFSGTATW